MVCLDVSVPKESAEPKLHGEAEAHKEHLLRGPREMRGDVLRYHETRAIQLAVRV